MKKLVFFSAALLLVQTAVLAAPKKLESYPIYQLTGKINIKNLFPTVVGRTEIIHRFGANGNPLPPPWTVYGGKPMKLAFYLGGSGILTKAACHYTLTLSRDGNVLTITPSATITKFGKYCTGYPCTKDKIKQYKFSCSVQFKDATTPIFNILGGLVN